MTEKLRLCMHVSAEGPRQQVNQWARRHDGSLSKSMCAATAWEGLLNGLPPYAWLMLILHGAARVRRGPG